MKELMHTDTEKRKHTKKNLLKNTKHRCEFIPVDDLSEDNERPEYILATCTCGRTKYIKNI
jgi:hypothetical protein